MSNVPSLTDDNFEAEVKNYEGVCLVDFFAVWCGPCKQMGPVVDELHSEMGDKAKIRKLDVQEAPGVAGEYGVMSIPTFIVFKNGEEVDRVMGACGKEKLVEMINAQL